MAKSKRDLEKELSNAMAEISSLKASGGAGGPDYVRTDPRNFTMGKERYFVAATARRLQLRSVKTYLKEDAAGNTVKGIAKTAVHAIFKAYVLDAPTEFLFFGDVMADDGSTITFSGEPVKRQLGRKYGLFRLNQSFLQEHRVSEHEVMTQLMATPGWGREIYESKKGDMPEAIREKVPMKSGAVTR